MAKRDFRWDEIREGIEENIGETISLLAYAVHADTIDRLIKKVEKLEKRVDALERKEQSDDKG